MLAWDAVEGGQLARGAGFTYLVASRHGQAVLTRWATFTSAAMFSQLAAEVALNAAAVPDVATGLRVAELFEAGHTPAGLGPAWSHPKERT